MLISLTEDQFSDIVELVRAVSLSKRTSIRGEISLHLHDKAQSIEWEPGLVKIELED